MGGLGDSPGTWTGFYSSTSTFPSRHSTKALYPFICHWCYV